MTLHRMIYASRPFGFDAAALGGIMVGARRNNARDGITGALICRADLYLQLLEGPAAAIDVLFGRIAADDRHLDVEPLVAGPVAARLFPAWDMLDDPARSWLWSPREVADGAVAAASPEAIVGVFARLAEERRIALGRGTADDHAARTAATCPVAASA